MDTTTFWTIIEGAEGNPGRLHDALDGLPREQLVAFERPHRDLPARFPRIARAVG
jgi:hypothetical protein